MESSIDKSALWLKKSDATLQVASVLYRMGHYCDSISRAYYAVFYSIRGLFAQDDIGAYKPMTMLAALGKYYVNTGKMEPCYHKAIFQVFDLRLQTEYECISAIDMNDAKFTLETAFIIVNEIRNNLIKEAEKTTKS